jgi:hypothetical protein
VSGVSEMKSRSSALAKENGEGVVSDGQNIVGPNTRIVVDCFDRLCEIKKLNSIR